MGFDNECILNIQSLAGEYFCPVCRLLVYPNEALQSLCTHLYCKPCLTYVVNTTRACPYDGYLVTEADSKPLIESNKSLAETISKIAVHCLFHRSGCTWQGTLSDCTSHCSGCAFGNSPVVCNRCGIQIMHRQVQEHAQSCPGVHPQVQAEGAAGATVDQTQSATPAAAVASQLQASQSAAAAAPGKDLNQQSISSSQAQALVQASVPTAEQWYQQQRQQSQQFYQQYPGYDQYQQYYAQQQQHLLAHASNAAGQLQPQGYTQLQPQSQPQSQPQPRAALVQASVAAQPQNQALITSQQQVHSVVIPHSQVQPHTHPPAHGHSQPRPQPYTQSQLHIQQQMQMQVQPHLLPSQPHLLSQAQPLGQPQPRPQPNKPLNAEIQSQTQSPTVNVVTDHHSYPQSKTERLMQTGVPQRHPTQLQSQFPQQTLVVRPPHSHATILSQQQQSLLPSQGRVQNTPPAQQSVQQPYFQQPGQTAHQRPVMQPVQQTFPQHHLQQQLPMPSQLRPQGQSHILPSQPSPNVASSRGMQHAKSPNPVGKPSMPSQGVPPQPYPQHASSLIRPIYPSLNQQSMNQDNMLKTSNQIQLPSEHSGANSKPTMSAKSGATDADVKPVLVDNAGAGMLTEKSNFDVKPVDIDNRVTGEVKANWVNTTSKEFKNPMGMQGKENGEPIVKPITTEGDLETPLMHSRDAITVDKKGVRNEGPGSIKHLPPIVEDKKTVDGSQQKNSPVQALEHHEGQVGNAGKDTVSSSDKGSQGVSTPSAQIHGSTAQSITAAGTASGDELKSSYQHGVQDTSNPQVAEVHDNRVFAQTSQVQAGGFMEPPYPIPDQGMHQPLLSHYRPPTFPQRPGAPPLGPPHQTLGLGPPETHFGPQVRGHAFHPPGSTPDPSATSFGRGPSQYGPAQQSSELQPVAPQGTYNPAHSGALPPAFDSHARIIARETSHGLEMFPNQRPNYMEGRRLDPHFPGSLEHGPHPEPPVMHPSLKRISGGLGDGRLHFQDERFNSFPVGPDHHVFDRAEFEDDLKKFPKPFDRESHGLRYNTVLKMESRVGSIPSRVLSPYDGGSSHYPGERKCGRHDDTFERMEPATGHHKFFGPGPSFGRRHMDSFGSRSPGREHPGIYSRGFGGSSSDDLHSRELRRFDEPFGDPFADSRFSMLPSHLHRGEFEGPVNKGMGNRSRNDFIGQDGFSSHLRRAEHMGNLYGHLRSREPDSFGAHFRHMKEIGVPGRLDLLGGGDRPGFPHLGEPGFRSSYSLHGFPNDGGILTEELAFDKLKRRNQPSMGWCRICKVDCETVEGLELHSQTREHQKMAMDMVLTIKQNAKKKKLNSGNQSSLGDASKSKNGGSEDCEKKN